MLTITKVGALEVVVTSPHGTVTVQAQSPGSKPGFRTLTIRRNGVTTHDFTSEELLGIGFALQAMEAAFLGESGTPLAVTIL